MACPAGRVAPDAGAGACVKCAVGRWQSEIGAARPCPEARSETVRGHGLRCLCRRDVQLHVGQCGLVAGVHGGPTGVGLMWSQLATETSSCVPCALGRFSAPAAESCTPCLAGSYGAGQGLSTCHSGPWGCEADDLR